MKTGALGKGGSQGGLKGEVDAHREALASRLGSGDDGMALGRANAAFLEACTAECFRQAATRVSLPPQGLALAAVGSFGRGAVALRSDADVMVVVDPRKVDSTRAEAFAEALLYPMWDATLAVGHQVLSASDALPLAQKDLATATALLDLRPLAGDVALLTDLTVRAAEGLFAEQ